MDHARLLYELVRIDSVNPSLAPGGAGEARVAEFVAAWLRDAGLDVHVYEVAPGRPNVIATVRGRSSGRSLMLNAHMDTVGIGGMSDPFVPRIEGDRLYGRGSYDMKGSLAAVMLAGAELAKNPPAGDVVVTAVCDEEYASIGTASVMERVRTDAAIVTEPTALDICVAHKGFAWFEVQSEGRAAHGSRPDLGVDAIARMGRVLVGLEELDRDLQARPRHRLLGSGSAHASLISGGQELSTYPASCALWLERRTVPGETDETVEREIRAVAGNCSVRRDLVRPAFEIAEDAEIVRELRSVVREARGVEPRIYGETPWFDSALISAAGIPCVIFGPGGGGAHADVEWSELPEVAMCARVLAAAARRFCERMRQGEERA